MGRPVGFRAWEKVLAKASWSFEAIYLGPKARHYNNGGGGGGGLVLLSLAIQGGSEDEI